MVYVSNGQVLDNRSQSPWRLSFFSDMLWGAVEFIGLFFQTLFQPDLSKNGNPGSSSRFSDGRGPPGFPGAQTDGKDKPWQGAHRPTNGWRWMRKVKRLHCVQARSAACRIGVGAEGPW